MKSFSLLAASSAAMIACFVSGSRAEEANVGTLAMIESDRAFLASLEETGPEPQPTPDPAPGHSIPMVNGVPLINFTVPPRAEFVAPPRGEPSVTPVRAPARVNSPPKATGNSAKKTSRPGLSTEVAVKKSPNNKVVPRNARRVAISQAPPGFIRITTTTVTTRICGEDDDD